MALRNKRSPHAGHLPHIVSGELAHNYTDDIFFFRSEGWLTGLSLPQARSRSLPSDGAEGAPLAVGGAGVVFDREQAPASLVNGRIMVDAPPPAGQYAIPGESITDAGASVSLTAGIARVERFYVPSTRLRIQDMAISVQTPFTGDLRVGLVQESNGSVLHQRLFQGLSAGEQVFTVSNSINRGWHMVVLWSTAPVTLDAVRTAAQERAFDLNAGDFAFNSDVWEGGADFSAGIDYAAFAPGPVITNSPLTEKSAVMRWTEG